MIDLAAASELGVLVNNTLGDNSNAVPELTIGHLIGCDRQIGNNTECLRNGKQTQNQVLTSLGLHVRVLGVIGAGAIAQRVTHVVHAM
jgi:D-3-phosphoglycerate dehydrogenase